MESVGSKNSSSLLQQNKQPSQQNLSQTNFTSLRQSTQGITQKQSSFSNKSQTSATGSIINSKQNNYHLNNNNSSSVTDKTQIQSTLLLSANTYEEKNINNTNSSELSQGLQIASKSQTQRLNTSIISSANQQYTSVSSTNKNSISINGNNTIIEKQSNSIINNTVVAPGQGGYGNLVINTIQNDQSKRHLDLLNIDANLANQIQIQENNTTNKTDSCLQNKQQKNVFYNPQGGDTESCTNNNNNNLNDGYQSNNEEDSGDDSTSYLNPFNKKKKNKQLRNTNNSTSQQQQQLQQNQIQQQQDLILSSEQKSLRQQQNHTDMQVHHSPMKQHISPRRHNHHHHHHHNRNNMVSDDGSGSDFSAEDGSPPDHHHKKQKFSINNNKQPLLSQQPHAHSDGNRDSTSDPDNMSNSSPGLLKEFQRLKNVDKYLIPPPEDLIAKTVFQTEPIRTGAPISFVKTDILKGDEKNLELMSNVKQKSQDLESAQQTRSGLKYIAEEIVKFDKENKVVYCRFGKQYIVNLDKQMNSALLNNGQNIGPNSNNTQLSQAIKGATYLINIKKLIKEHNIDTEYNNFQKLRTKQNVVNKQSDSGPALPYYTLENENDKTLLFESRFESGNLLCAIKVSDFEYDLILQNDINTNGHTQWYFFRVSNALQGMKVKFNILNLAKTDSLYNDGMKILAFSSNLKQTKGLGWHRVGSEISYYQNAYRRENMRQIRYYYTFTFTHEFEGTDNDQVYFAHCFPYTYSDLQDDLSRIEKEAYTQNFFYRNTLCRTLAGNKCEYITITSKERDPLNKQLSGGDNSGNNNNNNNGRPQKMGVFLSARVHPGESNASWMMKGLIDFLVSNAPEARALRERFVFKIVPMINPDGVINGNYRCSLCGSDLNRRWKTPSKVLHPVVFAIKRMVKAFSKEREIALYCDFHGHSRRKNIFMYGNNYSDKPDATRVFPYILSKLCDYFSFEYSRFSMHKSKESTARIAMWKELKIPNIFTLEASFSGADKGALKDQHFTTEHLMMCGRKLLEALIVYCKIDVQATLNEINYKSSQKRKSSQDQQIEHQSYNTNYLQFNVDNLQKELQENKELLKMTEGKDEGDGEGSSGSDSDPSEDNLEEEEIAKIVPMKTRKKKGGDTKKKSVTDARTIKRKAEEIPMKNLAKEKQQQKPMTKSPVKKIFNYSNPLYDRLKLRQLKKIEMVDAWTQTSDRGTSVSAASDTNNNNIINNQELENSQSKLRRVGSQANQKSKNSLLLNNNNTSNNNGSGMGITATQSFALSNLNSNNLTESQQQITSQNSDQYFQQLNNSQKVTTMQDSASSPQPQYRIRKEPFKQPSMSTNLSKFEEKLINNKTNNNNIGQNSQIESLNQLHFNGINSQQQRDESNNNQSSRMSKTPKDKNNINNNNNNNNSNSNNVSLISSNANNLGMTHNQSMKLNKAPYNNQVYGDFCISNNDQQFQNQHNRHFSSENFQGGFNMHPIQQNNALSSRANLQNSQQQSAAKDSSNNLSTVITSPKQIKNAKQILGNSKFNSSQKMGNNNNQLQQQNNNNTTNNMQQLLDQQQRFRSSLVGSVRENHHELSQNKNMIQIMTQGSFSNQRQSVQNSMDRTANRLNQLSNKKRLPEINEGQRLSQKVTIEQQQLQQQQHLQNLNANSNAFMGSNLMSHQFIPSTSGPQQHQKQQQQSHSQYKNHLNSSAQQIIRNQNIYSIQQSLMKNYGPQNKQQQPPEQVLYQTHITKSMDRNAYGRAIYQNLSTGQVQFSNNNNNQHSDYQNRVMQQQIQLQNVKMRTNNNNMNSDPSSANNSNAKTLQKQYL